MDRIEYNDTGAALRSEFPTIETSVGTMAYWKSLQLAEHGRLTLGGFEPPYTPDSPGSDKSITVNNVAYEGSIHVVIRRDGALSLDFSGMHRKGDWRSSVTAAAQTKLENEFLPLARELFPLPTPENIAAAIYRDAASSAYSAASSGVHKLSSEAWHDSRMKGHAEAIRAGVLAGLDKAKEGVAKETFETNTRY